jgi:hypothetical protein
MERESQTDEERYHAIMAELGMPAGGLNENDRQHEDSSTGEEVDELAELTPVTLAEMEAVLQPDYAGQLAPLGEQPLNPADVSAVGKAHMTQDENVDGAYKSAARLASVLGMPGGSKLDDLYLSSDVLKTALRNFHEWHQQHGKITVAKRVNAIITHIVENQNVARRNLSNKVNYDKWEVLDHYAYLVWIFEDTLVTLESAKLHALKTTLPGYSVTLRMWELVKRAKEKTSLDAGGELVKKKREAKETEKEKGNLAVIAKIATAKDNPRSTEALGKLAQLSVRAAKQQQKKEEERAAKAAEYEERRIKREAWQKARREKKEAKQAQRAARKAEHEKRREEHQKERERRLAEGVEQVGRSLEDLPTLAKVVD